MTHLHIDFETRSKLDIKRVGLDRYARAPEVLMMAYAFNDEAPDIWLPSEQGFPICVLEALEDPHVEKIAWNAAFERAIFYHALCITSPVTGWTDPSVMARYAGLPGKLALVSEFFARFDPTFGDSGKDKEGSRLINKFSKPHKSKKLGEHFKDWKDPKHAADWIKFQQYCKQDVVAEREIFKRLSHFFQLPEAEKRLWQLDAKINERGMPVSRPFVDNAQRIVTGELGRLQAELNGLTGLANANSGQQFLPWLKARG